VQLRGLAWGKDRLDEVTVKKIMEVTGKSRSTIYGHLGILRDRGWLLFNSAHYSWITVEFCGSGPDGEKESLECSDLAVDKPVDKSSRFLDCLNEDVNRLNTRGYFDSNNLHPHNNESLSAGIVQKTGQVSRNLDKPGNGWRSQIDQALEEKLERLGVFPEIYKRVADAISSGAWTLEQVTDLADEILDLGDSGGPGLFVYRLVNRIRQETPAEKHEKERNRFRLLYRQQKEAANGA